MTFLELPNDNSRDLALELFYAGDAADLDDAAELAHDLQGALVPYTELWEADALYAEALARLEDKVDAWVAGEAAVAQTISRLILH